MTDIQIDSAARFVALGYTPKQLTAMLAEVTEEVAERAQFALILRLALLNRATLIYDEIEKALAEMLK